MGFERCHPAVNFLYFAAVIAGTILFQHPVFLAISVVCAFLYSIKRSGWKAAIFNTVLLIFAVGFALYYSSYHHFGVTVLRQNFIGNNMTLEGRVSVWQNQPKIEPVFSDPAAPCAADQKRSQADQYCPEGHRQGRKPRKSIQTTAKQHPYFLYADHMDHRFSDHGFRIYAKPGKRSAREKSLFNLPL